MATEASQVSANPPHPAAVPPVDVIVSEVVANLALAAHAYLHPSAGEQNDAPDLGAAEIAIDVAAKAFERIGPRLGPGERSPMASMLTDLRFTYVKKRGP